MVDGFFYFLEEYIFVFLYCFIFNNSVILIYYLILINSAILNIICLEMILICWTFY
jgi:hypothetical protein